MEQRGQNHLWHLAWNKLIRRDLWLKARPHYNKITNHLIMAEDIAISFPLWFYVKKVSHSSTSYNFYLRGHEEASTTINSLTFKKASKSVGDLQTVFEFLDKFMSDVGAKKKHVTLLKDWKYFYSAMWHQNINVPSLTKKDKGTLDEILMSVSDFTIRREELDSHMYDFVTHWNDGLEKIKLAIQDESIKVVSFDIFDTLVTRPFGIPSDLFHLMDEYFQQLRPNFTLLSFYDIRVNAELSARNKHLELEDITLDHIYEAMAEDFSITEPVINKLKKKELELEVRFTSKRKTGYELYQLAKYLGKRIILTTDMYMPREAIVEILNSAEYDTWEDLYISSEIGKTKYSGSMFKHLPVLTGVASESILHIGDSIHSDFSRAQEGNLRAALLPNTTEVMKTSGGGAKIFNHISDNINGFSGPEFYGLRAMMAVIANKQFDNPFVSQVEDSFFNTQPSYIGYFALGMHLYSLANWLHRKVSKNQYDNLVFMARDGYLPMLAYKLLHDGNEKISYIPTSRKAILPLSIQNPDDINHVNKFLNINRQTIGDALTILDNIIDTDLAESALDSENITKKDRLNSLPYYKLINLLKSVINTEKISQFQIAFHNTWDSVFSGDVAVFDVGYSAKPEQTLAKVLKKPIDTYFIHSVAEGYERSLIKNNLRLHTFYNYKPALSSEIRELFISELSPSCTGYIINKNKLTAKFDISYHISYYEQFVIKSIQDNALQFVHDFIEIFRDYRECLTYTNQYASLPMELLTTHSSGIDKDLFRPFVFEDDMGAGVITDIATQHLRSVTDFGSLLRGKSKLTKAFVYAAIDRGEFIGRVKKKIALKTESYPVIHKPLKSAWILAKKAKKRFKKH